MVTVNKSAENWCEGREKRRFKERISWEGAKDEKRYRSLFL